MCTRSSEKLVPIYQTLRCHIRRACSLNGHHVTTSNVVGATIVTVTRSELFVLGKCYLTTMFIVQVIVRDSVGQCGTVVDSARQCGTVRDSSGQCGTVVDSVGQCGTVRDSGGQCGTVWDSTGQCGTVWDSGGQWWAVWDSG